MAKAANEIFVGKKPLMTYVTAALVQLANEPNVTIKARGMSITKAVDVSQIIVKRMDTLGYKINNVKIGSEQMQSQDGKTRSVSTIEIEVSRQK
ncbi:MAG: DNA-binding protein [Nitrososphaerales archaeon]